MLNPVFAEIRISEVELNPPGVDKSNEWIEFYSTDNIDLNGWTIQTSRNKELKLNGTYSSYFVINTSYGVLTNENIKLFLNNKEGKTIDETIIIYDRDDDKLTWSYCSGKWLYGEVTKGKENICKEEDETSEEEDETSEEEEEDDEEDEEDEEETSKTTTKTKDNEEDEEEIISVTSETKNPKVNEQQVQITEKIIYLGGKPGEDNTETITGVVVYESTNEKIKDYSVYSLLIMSLIFNIVLVIERFKNK
jgi:hypothetical protein